MSFPKVCTCCGRAHDVASWESLPWPAGGSHGICIEDDEGTLVLELKNCTCGSTLAIERAPEPSTESACHV